MSQGSRKKHKSDTKGGTPLNYVRYWVDLPIFGVCVVVVVCGHTTCRQPADIAGSVVCIELLLPPPLLERERKRETGCNRYTHTHPNSLLYIMKTLTGSDHIQ